MSVKVRCAPGTAAPLGSSTRPANEPRYSCPKSPSVNRKRTQIEHIHMCSLISALPSAAGKPAAISANPVDALANRRSTTANTAHPGFTPFPAISSLPRLPDDPQRQLCVSGQDASSMPPLRAAEVQKKRCPATSSRPVCRGILTPSTDITSGMIRQTFLDVNRKNARGPILRIHRFWAPGRLVGRLISSWRARRRGAEATLTTCGNA